MDAERLAARYVSLKRRLARIGHICNGSVMQLYRKCGKPGCGCKEDPKMQHGPRYMWTRKENGKTFTPALSKEHAGRCVEYTRNSRQMDSILEEMKKISTGIVEAGRQVR